MELIGTRYSNILVYLINFNVVIEKICPSLGPDLYNFELNNGAAS